MVKKMLKNISVKFGCLSNIFIYLSPTGTANYDLNYKNGFLLTENQSNLKGVHAPFFILSN